MNDNIKKGVIKYYSEKIVNHGATSKGVDWNSTESQYLRFEQLCKVITINSNFSICDFGCGYGELLNYINRHLSKEFNYIGFDISPEMIEKANQLYPATPSCKFSTQLPTEKVNYVIASGIFNIRLNLANDDEWLKYLLSTLQQINSLSTDGFSFNALTSYSDKEFMQDYLYYADPSFLFDYCKKNFSKNVALLHDYNLYEFTILVRK